MTALLMLVLQAAAGGLHDDGERTSAWSATASAGATAALRADAGRAGDGVRLDYDFQTGGGFVVLRREVSLDVPENFRVSLDWRGAGLANTVELKLVEGDNVWWNVQRHIRPPADWTRLTRRKRHFSFAWGPAAGAPLKRINAIEVAIAASEGGRGHIVLDNLRFESIAPLPPVTEPLRLRTSSSVAGGGAATLPEDGGLTWTSAPDDARPTVTIDFQQEREYGGLLLHWDATAFAEVYAIEASADGETWTQVAQVDDGDGGRDYVSLPDSVGRGLRVVVQRRAADGPVALRGLRLLPVAFGDSANAGLATIAADLPPGHLPAYLLGRQTYWTVVGVADDNEEALVDTFGAVEVRRGSYRVEPMLFTDRRLRTWADGTTAQALAEGYLPIPSVTWRQDELELTTTVLADGDPGRSSLWIQYALRNASDRPREVTLYLVVRPLQVLPPWQDLNMTGGAGRIERIGLRGEELEVDGRAIRSAPPADRFGATGGVQQRVTEYLAAGHLPAAQSAASAAGVASGALGYRLSLADGATQAVTLRMPLSEGAAVPGAESFAAVHARVSAWWRSALNRVTVELPERWQRLVDTFRTTQAYILINADGPAIQPGSRTYERSWIRDGALTSTALLYSGHAERVRRYIDWYSPHQFESGMVPCIVDRRGPDPVPEHDSTGEYVHLLWTYYRFTGDRGPLEANFARVERGAAYLDALRAERMTDEWRSGSPLQQACFGLVTESISHEGYSPARHSYWDSFFVVRGYRDAAAIARVLGADEAAAQMTRRLTAYRESLYRSMDRAMAEHEIDYIPGCVELGDFDATSTAIGVYPGGERSRLPAEALAATFDRYLAFFRGRRDGTEAWDAYTPYELRIVATLVLLGRSDAAHELLDYFLAHQRPAGWNHWAEVVHRDPLAAKFIGDMPHTWVGSGFMNAFRTLLVHEREEDATLVLCAGLRSAWLDDPRGVRVANLPTAYGAISYTIRRVEGRMHFRATGDLAVPTGGVRVVLPFAEIARVEPATAGEVVGPHEVRLRQWPADLHLDVK